MTDAPKAELPMFLTASEAAELMRIDESTIYRHLRQGRFPGIKIGGRYVVPTAVINRMVDDVMTTGRCIDLLDWTMRWREQQSAVVERLLAAEVTVPYPSE